MLDLSVSQKDYIEAIYILYKQLGSVRSIDIVNHLHHTRASISVAIQSLIEKGYVEKINNRIILTEKGNLAAEEIIKRHCVLTHALQSMGIDSETAIREAKQMERTLSDLIINRTAEVINCKKLRTQDNICEKELTFINKVYGTENE